MPDTVCHCRALLGLAASFACTSATALTLVTEEFPPLNYSPDQGTTVIGAATDLAREILRRTGTPATFVMMPWRNALKRAHEEKETCVYATARTEDREKHFQWVGPLATGQWAFYSTPQRGIVAQRLDDLRPYVIGSYHSDVRAGYLKANGFQLDEALAEEQNIKKLAAGKIDLWLATTDSAPWLSRKHHIPVKQVLALHTSTFFIACNLEIPTLLFERMNAALRNMAADGTTERLITPYGLAKPPAP